MGNSQLAVLVVFYAIIGTLGLALMKRGLPTDVAVFPLSVESVAAFVRSSLNAAVIVGFLFYAVSFATSMVLLAARPMSFIYPIITAAAYVGAVAIGFLVFRERVTPQAMLGIVLIAAGLFFLSRGGG